MTSVCVQLTRTNQHDTISLKFTNVAAVYRICSGCMVGWLAEYDRAVPVTVICSEGE